MSSFQVLIQPLMNSKLVQKRHNEFLSRGDVFELALGSHQKKSFKMGLTAGFFYVFPRQTISS